MEKIDILTGLMIATGTVVFLVVLLLSKGYDWKSKSAGNSINR